MAEKKNDGMAEVFIPRESANQDPNYFVGINGINYILPRGKKSKVPEEVAFEINRSLDAKEAMYEARDALKAKAN